MKSKKSHSDGMPFPSFSGVTLVEYRDHIELAPTYWVREFVGLAKIQASEIKPKEWSGFSSVVYESWGDREVWVVMRWERYEDGTEKPTMMNVMDGTEAEARRAAQQMMDFCNMSKDDLEELGKCLKQTEEDLAYVRNRFPDSRPAPQSIEEYDLYQARLKVLAGMQPKTITLMEQAYATEDPAKRETLEREAVQAYFAELAHVWGEHEVKEWQRNNPIGTEWMCEFGRVFQEPKRELDPINHELVLNWLRKKYNLLTAEELSNAILIMTGQRLSPETLKKRRERLGLTTKRPPGPRTKLEQLRSKLKKLF